MKTLPNRTAFSTCGLAAAFAVFSACETPTSLETPDLELHRQHDRHRGGQSGKIVFVSFRDGNAEIYVMNADGSEPENLTNDLANDTEPRWSPNGRKIVFTSNRADPDAPGPPRQEIHTMNADGSDVERVIETTGSFDGHPDFSPDGRKIAFSRFGAPPPALDLKTYVVNVDGSGLTNLTGDIEVLDAWPRWSPNGKRILFNSATSFGDFDIYVMNADGSGRTNVTNTPGTRNDFFASWSPNGKQIAFTGALGAVPNLEAEDIYVMNIDGSGLRQVTTDPGRDLAPVWSPDGKNVAFNSLRGGPPDIFTINRDGTNETQLTTNAAPDFYPDWRGGARRGRDDHRRGNH